MKDISFGPYSKFIVAVIGALGTWAIASLADGNVTTPEWIALISAVLTALGVYQVTNKEKELL